MNQSLKVSGRLVDIFSKEIYPATIIVEDDRIVRIERIEAADEGLPYLIPGLIDAHIHIESSMLVPSEFARLAVVHGTVATVSDPHEIANVCGVEGVEFMIENGKTVPFKFYFGAPSCVPATSFETAGAVINSDDIERMLMRDDILYLSEMMNFPGVLNNDPEVMKKIKAAKKYNKPVDGHAPGLRGSNAKKYIDAGISTDHECFTKEEALEKLQYGMKIIIREGSAAKNFDALADLLHEHWEHMMFCSDDKHPDSLVADHINALCARSVARGIDVFKVLIAACKNPVEHYKLKCGLLRVNDFADFVLVKDLKNFEVLATYISGKKVAENGKSFIAPLKSKQLVNNFNCKEKIPADFQFKINSSSQTLAVIEVLDGQLITNKIELEIPKNDGCYQSDPENDVLKIVVVNRYQDAPIAKGFIKGFGLKSGAIASSVAHDSHNIVAVGTDDESICIAVNRVIKEKGGVSWKDRENEMVLPLPVAGLMSTGDGYEIAEKYKAIDKAAKSSGSRLASPFMSLSFMALLVIPHLKLSDLGMFDGDSFKIISQP